MSGRKTITINFLQGIPAPIVALGGMIKVFLFYPLLCVTLQKIQPFCAPTIQQVQNKMTYYSSRICGDKKSPCISIVLIYLLYLTKDFEKKKITMVKPFARSSGMDILNLAAPPGQSLRDGLAGDPYEGFYLIT